MHLSHILDAWILADGYEKERRVLTLTAFLNFLEIFWEGFPLAPPQQRFVKETLDWVQVRAPVYNDHAVLAGHYAMFRAATFRFGVLTGYFSPSAPHRSLDPEWKIHLRNFVNMARPYLEEARDKRKLSKLSWAYLLETLTDVLLANCEVAYPTIAESIVGAFERGPHLADMETIYEAFKAFPADADDSVCAVAAVKTIPF